MTRFEVRGLATESDMRYAKHRLEAIQEGTTILILLELNKIGVVFPEKCPECGNTYRIGRYNPNLQCNGSPYNEEPCTPIILYDYVPKKEVEP